MLYAFSYGGSNLAVAAATSVIELQLWFENVRKTTNGRPQEDFDGLFIPVLATLPHPAYLFEFADISEQMAFVAAHHIDVLHDSTIRLAQEEMEGIEDSLDTRPIGEILGLTKDDPWDKGRDVVGGRMRDDVMIDTFNPTTATNSGVKITDITITGTGEVVVNVTAHEKDQRIPEILYAVYDFPTDTTLDGIIDDLMGRLRETKTKQRVEKIEERIRLEMSKSEFSIQNLIDNVMNSIIRDQIDKVLARSGFNPDQQDEYNKILAALDLIENFDPSARDVFKEIAYENVYGGANVDITAITFCQNQRLTDNPSFGGPDVPVFHIKKGTSTAPAPAPTALTAPPTSEFTEEEMTSFLALRFGLRHISSDLYTYEILAIDPNYQADIKQHLIDAGMNHDPSIQPNVRRLDVADLAEPTDLEIMRSLSTEENILPEFNTYSTNGIAGWGGNAPVEQDTELRRFAVTQLDPTLQKMLSGIDDQFVMYGNYTGPYVNDRIAVITISAEDRIIAEGCWNVIPLGGSKTKVALSVLVAQADSDGVGILTLRTSGGVKVYRINAPTPVETDTE